MLFDSIRNQNGLERLAIFVTVFIIPVSIDLWTGWTSAGLCIDCVDPVKAVIYIVAFMFASTVIAIASNLNESRAEQRLTQTLSMLKDSIAQVQEEHDLRLRGNERRLTSLERWIDRIQHTLGHQGHDLSVRTVRADADRIGPVIFGISEAEGHAIPPPKFATFRRWCSSQRIRLNSFYRKWIKSKD